MGRARTGGKKVAQRFELSEREHQMLQKVASVNEETYVEIFRRLLREEYRYLVREGYIKDPSIPKRNQK